MRTAYLLVLVMLASQCSRRKSTLTRNASAVPPNWTVAMTHEGGAPKWEIVADASAPSNPTCSRRPRPTTRQDVPLAIYERASFTSGSLSAPVQGDLR